MKHKIALLLTALFLVAGLSWALMPAVEETTYYVNGSTGSDTEAGYDGLTAAKPYKTIGKALSVLKDADGYVTIQVAAGTYPENVSITRSKVTLNGAGQNQTIIGGQTYTNAANVPVIIIGTDQLLASQKRGVTISNLKVKSNGHIGTRTANANTIEIKDASSEVDPNTIENVTVEHFVPLTGNNNEGNGIYVGFLNTGTILRNVTVSGHATALNINASTLIEGAVLNGGNTAEYGIKANLGTTITMRTITATGYTRAAIYNAISAATLTGSTLSESTLALEGKGGSLAVSNTNMYSKGNGSLIQINNMVLTLGEATHLYKQFADYGTYGGFFTYGTGSLDLVKTVADNGTQYHYGANYASSRVIKVANSSGLKNAYPIEMLATVFAVKSNGTENANLSSGDVVTLPAGDPITTKKLQVFQQITLNGNDVTLQADATAPATDVILQINYAGEGSTIRNLTLTGAAFYGIQADKGATLNAVTLTKNYIGMLVYAGTMHATNLTSSSNTLGGVVLGAQANLTLTNGEHISDLPAVYTFKNTANLGNVSTDGVSWKAIAGNGGYAANPTYYWVRAFETTISKLPLASDLKRGEQLWNSILTEGKVMYDGEEVQGVFQWANPRKIVEATGLYDVVFIPANQKKYALITGLQVEVTPVVYHKVTTGVSDWGKIMIENPSADHYYRKGQVLKLTYVPYKGYKVNPGAPATYVVDNDAEISNVNTSIFAPASPDVDGVQVKFPAPKVDGRTAAYVQVFFEGMELTNGDYVYPGSILNVVVTPEAGYALKSLTYQYGTPVLNGLITAGNEPINIQAVMEVKPTNTYMVTLRQMAIPRYSPSISSFGFVMLHDDMGTLYMPGMAVPTGTKLRVTVTPAFGYKLNTIAAIQGAVYVENVNGVATYTVSNNAELEPQFDRVKYAVAGSFDNPAAGSFRLYTSYPTQQLSGDQYDKTPVTIAVSMNTGYTLEAIIANGKELRITNRDQWPFRLLPALAGADVNGTTTFRVITRKKEDLQIDETQQVYTYYNNSYTGTVNHRFIAKAVTAGLERIEGFAISYRENSSTGDFNVNTLSAGKIYDVRVQRDADDYYNALDVVIRNGLKILDNYLPLRDMTHVKTDNPAKPSFGATATYDGSVFGNLATNPVTSNNWVVTYRQQNIPVQYPVNAGTYDIIGFRAADTLYTAQTNVKLGTFTIGKAVSNASVTYATDILQGQSLAASRLSGNAHIDGVFSWASPETKMTTAGVITTNKAIFTPYSSNYTTDTNLATSLNVLAMAAGNLRTITVNVTNPEKGTYTLTREAIPVGAGTIITAGERIRVSFDTIDPAYTAVLKINGVQYPNGATYTVGATGDMVISLDFMPIGQAPAMIGVTGINLSSLEKSVVAGDEFILTPMITPSNASDQRVFWTSDNEWVATVADGKVTVLHAGSAVITATTANGHSVSCVLTSHLTANESAFAGVQVYTIDKQYICIEAGSPVKVVITDALGRIVYHAGVNQRQLVNLPAGTYFVVVADQNTQATLKVVL